MHPRDTFGGRGSGRPDGAALEAARTDVEALADDLEVSVVDAGHFIHEEQPDAVIDAIRDIIDQVGS
jgi:pimeloyl-ACP methyl ester carboxylesterase